MSCIKNAETIEFEDPDLVNQLFGPQNLFLDLLANKSGAKLSNRGATLFIESENALLRQQLSDVFIHLYSLLRKGYVISKTDFVRAFDMIREDPGINLEQTLEDSVFVHTPRKTVRARNLAQKRYLELLREKDLVFALGPAGTGKTYLAVAMALSMLQKHRVKRLVLTRPAVEAGEKLGFLPGDLVEKINPYLRPLYDALYDMVPQPKIASMLESGIIEIAPLAFMRGRTLNDSFIILDEAQNSTREQMKMFLTRMGFGSRMVITGDASQIDLPPLPGSTRPQSGLVHAIEVLKEISGLGIYKFSPNDVVRHPIVGAIVSAYDKSEKTNQNL